jgi:hypothetical protein
MPDAHPIAPLDLQQISTRNTHARHIVAGCASALPALADVWQELADALSDMAILAAQVTRLAAELERTRLDRANLRAAMRAALSTSSLGNSQETSDLIEEFVFNSALAVPIIRPIIERLGRILKIDEKLSFEEVLMTLPKIFADRNMAAVSAVCWLMMQACPGAEPVSMRAILSRLRTVLAWRPGSERIAGNLAHLVGHSSYLSRPDSLRCHRVAAGLLQQHAEDSWAYGTALYCLGHRLHEIKQVSAAMRRYKQARDIFVIFLGVDNNEVAHLDFHLNNPDEPYGKVLTEDYD